MRLGHRHRDFIEADLRVPFRRQAHTLHQRHRLIDRKPLPLAVVRNLRQVLVHQFDAATVEKLSITCDGHEYCPTAVIRYADDCVAL